MNQNDVRLADAAFKVVAFVKTNEYPEKFSDKFFEMTQLLDALETELRREGWIPNGCNFKKLGEVVG